MVVYLNLFLNKFNFLNDYFKNNENVIESLYLKNINNYFLKLNFIYFLIFRNFYSFFLFKNKKLISNKLNKQIFINNIY